MVEKKKNEDGNDDFIGWKSKDGKLEVIGITGKDKWGAVS